MNRQQRRANKGRLEKGLPLVLSAPKANCRSPKAAAEVGARNYAGNPRHHRYGTMWLAPENDTGPGITPDPLAITTPNQEIKPGYHAQKDSNL